MPINIYETRTMLAAINRYKKPKSFLKDTFFSTTRTAVTEKIDVDFKKGKRLMAPFVAPMVGGIASQRQGFTTKTYSVPKIAPERIMTSQDIQHRGMGEGLYSTKSPEQRAAEILGRDLIELDDMITRREEWMCREVIINGSVTMKGLISSNDKYIEETVDYQFDNKEVLSGDDLWSSDASDPYEYLKEKKKAILKSTGQAPDVVILSDDVENVFIHHPKVVELSDIRRYSMGVIQPKIINPAVTLIAFFPELNLEIYTYNEWFINDEGQEESMIPEGYMIMGRVGMGRLLYGAVTQVEEKASGFITYEGTRIPKNWIDTNNDMVKLRVSSRPLPVPEDADDWYVAQVI